MITEIDMWSKKANAQSRSEAIRRLVQRALGFASPKAKHADPSARAAGQAYARKVATEQIDQALEGSGQSNEVKGVRKQRLLKGPAEFREMRGDNPKSKG